MTAGALLALLFTGCPEPGGGDSISKGDAQSESGEDATQGESLDATSESLDGRVPDAAATTPDARPTPDAAAPTPDAGTEPDTGPDAALPPDAAVGDCKAGDTRVCEGCAQGTQACVEGFWGPCVGTAETCNGLDDDCNGATDEPFEGLGQPCSAGVGVCESEGVFICGADALSVVCGAAPGQGGIELCDGLDNDCNGTVDLDPAGRPLGEPCYTGPADSQGVGVCRAGAARCDGAGLPGACDNQVLPSPEVCDGLDNDCDGLVDEGPDGGALVSACFDGPEDALDQGLCRAGIRRCEGGIVGACEGQILPTDEVCDSVDNDCDGLVDNPPDRNGLPQSCACEPGEVRACYGGPEGTEGLGRCVAGTQTCLPDGSSWGICDGQVLPTPEICNGEDDDCSGVADDALEGAGAACSLGTGACVAVGVVVCDPMGFELVCDAVPGAPVDERCDGLDNNCDGRVDEAFPLGEACALGLGQCLVQGALACDAEGGVSCDAVPTDPVAEICDGLDNDCDGESDNGFDLGAACSVGVGECVATGGLVCDGEGGVRCGVLPGEPGLERCNGLDDDCDGQVDDQPTDVGGACDTGRPGACARGAVVCVEGALACGAGALPTPETCNDIDDDCNGVTDDTAGGALLTQACYDGPGGTSGVGPCAGGRQTCRAGRFGPCEGQTLPGAEVCDTVDNNCDGRVDNLAVGMCACEPGSSAVCYTGAAGTSGVGACRSGRWTCNPDGLAYGACEGQTTPAVEVCDGVDNDCNGQVDDAIAGTGGACSAGVGDCNARGVLVCDPRAGRIVCNAVAGQPRAELCDARDNDCDGTVDDGFAIGAACSAGVGACLRNGVQACNAQGALSCGAVAGMPAAETCNNIDDDCDGVVDDGLNLGAACTVGVGACARQGRNVCGANGAVVCNAVAGNPAPEVCDGADNNCNGTTDENNPGGGGACNTGLQGVCSQGVLACVNAGLRCQQSVQSSAEVCDGRDNNCNGTTDENAAGGALTQACYDGAAGTQNRGICRGGTQTCQAGGYGACVGQVLPAPADICDGLDNNCNGTTDEQPNGLMCACQPGATRACYSGAAGTQGVGICRAGTQTCAADGLAWGACAGETLPAAEVCDNLDNNCNGTTDDAPGVGLACTAGQGDCLNRGVNRCNVQTRQVECSVTAGAPTPEVCDGRDNNCNGTTDDVAGLGAACTNGVGACQRAGNNVCDLANRVLVCNAVAGLPAAETCDGVDNNCNGATDDGRLPGVGVGCQVGVGECLRSGATVCNGAAGVGCGVQAGAPSPELCDSLDNNCNGAIDDNPTDVGQRCTQGVGACQASGLTVCDGQLYCTAQPGAPVTEVCDNTDNDCDGSTDESLNCNIYKSCLDAQVRGGAVANGIYRLQPVANGPISNVYCDLTTDRGGWTLVGSAAGQALDDARGDWHADLMTLAPALANTGVWNGLTSLSERFDLRFACRAGLAAADAPMAVDLSFYRTGWYREITAGTDDQSCFSEDSMQDFPAPARRNNLTSEYRGRRDQWDYGQFEGEDVCGDASDFTVDFDDRGMDSNQGDGTDWGEDDGALKCGANGLATGQWFIFARERTRVAVVGPESLQPALAAMGFSATTLTMDANLPTLLDPDVYETLLLGRYSFNWPSLTAAVQTALRAFSNAGGNVVTEYDGAAIFGASIAGTFQQSAGAPRPFSWFRYQTNGGSVLAAGTPMAHAAAGDGLLSGLANPFNFGGAGEYFTTLQPPALGGPTYITPVATFAGNGTPAFPQGNWPAVARGRRCGGNFVFGNFDYNDEPNNPGVRQFLKNAVEQSFLPPLSANEDVCRDTPRPNLMLCGASERPVASFVRGGQALTVVNGCVPNNDTQAMLITRSGVGQFVGANLQTYLNAGGIVITEYSTSDEVYNAVFGGGVVAGAGVGACSDNVQPTVQYGALDSFWEENRFESVGGNTGCGFDMAAYPGIVPLGGPAAGVVTLAYRDYQSRGRVYFVESDWQDTQASFTAQSAGLMHYMINHGAGGALNFSGPEAARSLATATTQGFSVCFQTPYSSTVPVANVQAACTQGVLMMACRQANSQVLTVSAMANWSDVFFNVGAGFNAVHTANATDWYFDLASSWGFAPQGAGVARSSCDTLGTVAEQRLCWHTGGNNLTGGYRCGATTGLNGDATWERIVLQRRGSL